MHHPKEEVNRRQAEQLAAMSGEDREFWARQFRIGNAAYCYQEQFKEVAKLETTGEGTFPQDLLVWIEQQLSQQPENRSAQEVLRLYFEEYLEGLPTESIRKKERALGLEQALRSWPFRRYVLERNDLGMDEFMKKNLSADDFAYYVESGKP